jgi:hypothetical protein
MKTIWQYSAKNKIQWLEQYDLRKKIIVYVKYERFNLNIITVALKLVVSCEKLGSMEILVLTMHFFKHLNM